MSKITNDGLTRSGTGCLLYSCTHTATVGVKQLKLHGFNVNRDLVARSAGVDRVKLPAAEVADVQFQVVELSEAVAVSDAQNGDLQPSTGRV